MAATPAPADSEPGRLIVVLTEADCSCEYDVEPSFGANNAACVTFNLVVNPHVPPPECFIVEECGPKKDCQGSFKGEFTINNWGQCCPGGAGNNMLTCVNGSPATNIPNGFGGVVSETGGGTKLACQPNSDSSDLDSKTDEMKVVCGNDCTAGIKFTVEFKEFCYACPAGSDG